MSYLNLTQTHCFNTVRTLCYEFRVLEVVDFNNNIVSVNLQSQVGVIDEYGNKNITQFWENVPRIRIKEGEIPPP